MTQSFADLIAGAERMNRTPQQRRAQLQRSGLNPPEPFSDEQEDWIDATAQDRLDRKTGAWDGGWASHALEGVAATVGANRAAHNLSALISQSPALFDDERDFADEWRTQARMNIAADRRAYDQFHEEAPATALTSELAGGLVGGMNLARGAQALADAGARTGMKGLAPVSRAFGGSFGLQPQGNLASRIGQYAAGGAGYGALYGWDRDFDPLESAAYGAALSPLFAGYVGQLAARPVLTGGATAGGLGYLASEDPETAALVGATAAGGIAGGRAGLRRLRSANQAAVAPPELKAKRSAKAAEETEAADAIDDVAEDAAEDGATFYARGDRMGPEKYAKVRALAERVRNGEMSQAEAARQAGVSASTIRREVKGLVELPESAAPSGSSGGVPQEDFDRVAGAMTDARAALATQQARNADLEGELRTLRVREEGGALEPAPAPRPEAEPAAQDGFPREVYDLPRFERSPLSRASTTADLWGSVPQVVRGHTLYSQASDEARTVAATRAERIVRQAIDEIAGGERAWSPETRRGIEYDVSRAMDETFLNDAARRLSGEETRMNLRGVPQDAFPKSLNNLQTFLAERDPQLSTRYLATALRLNREVSAGRMSWEEAQQTFRSAVADAMQQARATNFPRRRLTGKEMEVEGNRRLQEITGQPERLKVVPSKEISDDDSVTVLGAAIEDKNMPGASKILVSREGVRADIFQNVIDEEAAHALWILNNRFKGIIPEAFMRQMQKRANKWFASAPETPRSAGERYARETQAGERMAPGSSNERVEAEAFAKWLAAGEHMKMPEKMLRRMSQMVADRLAKLNGRGGGFLAEVFAQPRVLSERFRTGRMKEYFDEALRRGRPARMADEASQGPMTARARKFAPAPRFKSPGYVKYMADAKWKHSDGTPFRFFHGTDARFEEFGTDFIFMSRDPDIARAYGDRQIELISNVSNPKVIDWRAETGSTRLDEARLYDMLRQARREGHDGAVIKNVSDTSYSETGRYPKKTSEQYVAFDPRRVKSTENRGSYDGDSANMFYSRSGGPARQQPDGGGGGGRRATNDLESGSRDGGLSATAARQTVATFRRQGGSVEDVIRGFYRRAGVGAKQSALAPKIAKAIEAGRFDRAFKAMARHIDATPDVLRREVIGEMSDKGMGVGPAGSAALMAATSPETEAQRARFDAGQEFGVPLSRGQLSDDAQLQAREEAYRRGAYGGQAAEVMERFDTQQRDAVDAAVDTLTDDLAGGLGVPTDPLGAAIEASEGVATRAAARLGHGSKKYGKLNQVVEGVGFRSARGISEALDTALDDMGFLVEGDSILRVHKLLKRQLEAAQAKNGGALSFEALDKIRGALLARQRGLSATDGQQKRQIGMLRGALDDWVDEQLGVGPGWKRSAAAAEREDEALNRLMRLGEDGGDLSDAEADVVRRAAKDARTYWRQYKSDFGGVSEGSSADRQAARIVKAMAERDMSPEEVVRTVFGLARVGETEVSRKLLGRLNRILNYDPRAKGSMPGTSADMAAQLRARGMEGMSTVRNSAGRPTAAWQAVRGAAFRKLVQAPPGGRRRGYGVMADAIDRFADDRGFSAARELFEPAEIERMRRLSTVLRSLEYKPGTTNPSGTAWAAARLIQSLFGAMAGAQVGGAMGGPVGVAVGALAGGAAGSPVSGVLRNAAGSRAASAAVSTQRKPPTPFEQATINWARAIGRSQASTRPETR